jgi:prolyl oligopeptidase
MSVRYPEARRADTVDVLHGVAVPDPYRWLEDADGGETRRWVAAQNELTRSQLDGARRDTLIQRLITAFDVRRSAAPITRGGRCFFLHNTGLQKQAVLYVCDRRGRTVGAEPRPILDPNGWSEDGTTALTGVFPSNEGHLVAYALSHGGSDRQQMRVRDVETRADLPDVIEWVKFASIAWTPAGSGFYYLRFPAPGTVAADDTQYYGRIYLHLLGTPQSDDPLVFEYASQKEVVPLVDITSDGSRVIITCQRGASDDSEIYLIDGGQRAEVGGQGFDARALFTGFDAAYAYVGSHEGRLLFRTTKEAPMGRIIGVAADGVITDLVPEASDRLVEAVVARDRIAAVYLRNASSDLRMFDRNGASRGSVELPGLGTITTIDADPQADDVVFAFTSFTQPSTVYFLAPEGESHRLLPVEQSRGFRLQPEDTVTSQVWFPSRDGTSVSMFLVHRPDLPSDGARPVLLGGYGGFNISRTPQFDPAIGPLLERGGIFALANLRGGGEYGEAWHQAGMRDRKQNVFDDFIAAAEFLIAEGYTTPRHLAIEGGSNGGLLVGAVMLQRPDLFGAVVCRVPVADMLRYHLFTIGRFWIPEYGSADDPVEFRYLLRYSPYHNVRVGTEYPPTLVMTADTDDRVDPGMAKKFAARLQAEGAGGPFLLRVETKAGHGAGKPVTKLIEEDADILAFLETYI